MMHAKTAVVDRAWSIVGSANLDERSMELNEENVLGVADQAFAQAIERGLTEDFAAVARDPAGGVAEALDLPPRHGVGL